MMFTEYFYDGFHLPSDIIIMPHLQFPDIDHIVDLIRTVFDRLFCLKHLRFQFRLTQRERDRRSHMHIGIIQKFPAGTHLGGIDSHHGKPVSGRLLT